MSQKATSSLQGRQKGSTCGNTRFPLCIGTCSHQLSAAESLAGSCALFQKVAFLRAGSWEAALVAQQQVCILMM